RQFRLGRRSLETKLQKQGPTAQSFGRGCATGCQTGQVIVAAPPIKSGHCWRDKECPLWVISGYRSRSSPCPFYPRKGTWLVGALFLSGRLENQGCDRVRM